MVRAELPPPAIFTHNETLHAILLPPLATFVTGLSDPQHLIKLHDILQRFRTPKSYHRVDVREVESSDLPPDDHGQEDAAGGKANETKAAEKDAALGDAVMRVNKDEEATRQRDEHIDETGESKVITKEGTSQPEIVPVPAAEKGDGDTYTGEAAISEEQRSAWKEEKGDPIILPEGVNKADYLLETTRQAVDGVAKEEASLGPEEGAKPRDPQATEATSTSPPTLKPVDQARPAASSSIHPLPPSGPTRRVRELRLDLRTLDAAALFALETWRREHLGLEKLDMDHPDSIWYKEPTPTPEPSPEPVRQMAVSSQGGKRGRAANRRMGRAEVLVVGEDISLEVAEEGGGGYSGLMQALEEHEMGDAKEEVVKEAMSDPAILAALRNVAEEEGIDGELPVSVGQADPDASEIKSTEVGPAVATEGQIEEEGEEELDDIGMEEEKEDSPDIILDDLYDRREDQDPDFVPPSSPIERSKKSGPRKGQTSSASDPLTAVDSSSNLDFGWSSLNAPGPTIIDLTIDQPDSPPQAGPSRLKAATTKENRGPDTRSPRQQASASPTTPRGPSRKRVRVTMESVEIPSRRRAKRGRRSVRFADSDDDLRSRSPASPFHQSSNDYSATPTRSSLKASTRSLDTVANAESTKPLNRESITLKKTIDLSPTKTPIPMPRASDLADMVSFAIERDEAKKSLAVVGVKEPQEADEEWGFLRDM